ncbi:19735_t:CDS:2, partial [Racocetra fulgida]
KNPAFDFESEPKINDIERCYAKISMLKDENELFLLKKHIEILPFINSLPSKLIKLMIPSMNFSSNNPLVDDIYLDDIFLEVVYPKFELIYEKESMQPTEEIKRALASQTIINLDYESEIDELSNNSSKLNQLLDSWESEYSINVNYFMTTDYDAITKETIAKWINTCSKHDIEALKVIGQSDFFPLYEIFEKPISERIKLILEIGDEKQVLMTGITQIHKDNNYYRISFSDKLDRNKYQIFAKITRADETNKQIIDVVNEAIIKIKSATRTGFVAIIENLDKLNVNAQKISTLDSGTIMIKPNQKDLLLGNIPEKPMPNSIMILLYESKLPICPKNEDGKIEFNIDSLFITNNKSETTEFIL